MIDTAANRGTLTIPGIEDIKCRIQPLLISRKYYDEKLSDLVSNDFLDLKVCYYIPDDGGIRLISNELLNAQDIPADLIKSQALENMRSSCSYGIMDLEELLTHMCASKMSDAPDLRSPFPIYVLTNKKGFLGATGILLEGLLADFSETIENSFFILPSSMDSSSNRIAVMLPSSSFSNVSNVFLNSSCLFGSALFSMYVGLI